MARRSEISRRTSETEIEASADMDGGPVSVSTGSGFVDHLLSSFAKHAGIGLEVSARSVDGIAHHLVEDAAICVGRAVDEALGSREGIARFGRASVPMDEALADAALDLVRRPYQRVSLSLERDGVEGVPREDLEHLFQSLLQNMCCCAHVEVRYGDNDHHKAEAAAKALAVALREAARQSGSGAPSTKGAM
ncbi:MAG: imidazoleglycerol-phosphate dehydratase [Nitrosopumilus sp.]|nr:imidazoleglycerol-phosphate dehydratase [Nitrosopumilus sp.]MDA7942277.1 imidazoleglycerol-phosphate dehydratase [Nitrosopumilus sp.]MDA7943496.1 imidazoleglycerol-phosphate dehydratase [Nitrosopumilus sp.]MDA7944925.1 imidazoleglycerol-phosphate dehydratase [Nitrosopumilus sp.]MDA7953366.1 imidazoleglycerol-phosphate dehydratase [Nitrosopumilus sp.]